MHNTTHPRASFAAVCLLVAGWVFLSSPGNRAADEPKVFIGNPNPLTDFLKVDQVLLASSDVP